MPTKESGVNRGYIVRFYLGQCLCLNLLDVKRFEVEPTESQTRKTLFLNLGKVVERFETYLKELNLPPLGFPPNVIPEEKYLLRRIHYLDRKNILGVFQKSIPNSAELSLQSHGIQKANAREYLISDNTVFKALKVAKQFIDIMDSGWKVQGLKQDCRQLERTLERHRKKLELEDTMLHTSLNRAATTIFTIGNQIDDPNQIFTKNGGEQFRAQINEILLM